MSSDSTIAALFAAGFAVNLVGVLVSWFRRRSLGPTLHRTPPHYLWALCDVVCAVLLVGVVLDKADPFSVFTFLAGFCLVNGIRSLWTNRLSLHPGGLAIGGMVVPWSKLQGWRWEPVSNRLTLWVPRLLPFRFSPHYPTCELRSAELEALLQRYAPEHYRAAAG